MSPQLPGQFAPRYEFLMGPYNSFVQQMRSTKKNSSLVGSVPTIAPTGSTPNRLRTFLCAVDASVGIAKNQWTAELSGTQSGHKDVITVNSAARPSRPRQWLPRTVGVGRLIRI